MAEKGANEKKNGCLTWANDKPVAVSFQRETKIYAVGVRQILYYDRFKTTQNMVSRRRDSCIPGCISPEHATRTKDDIGTKKQVRERREKNNILKRIVKMKNGCWTHVGATDAAYRGTVTTMRSAVHQIVTGKKPSKRSDFSRNIEKCVKGCINPDHVVKRPNSIERYIALCTMNRKCLTYTGKMSITTVRTAFRSENKKRHELRRRRAGCHERCVDPNHLIRFHDEKELFMNKTKTNQGVEGCWKYSGCHITSANGKQTTIRRAAWLLFRKDKPAFRIHTKIGCEIWCVNPEHLVSR